MRDNSFYPVHGGMRLLRLPETRLERENTRRRGVAELGSVTACEAMGRARISTDAPVLLSGSHSAALPFLRQLLRRSARPFVLVGTEQDLGEGCLAALAHDWALHGAPTCLPDGNGLLTLDGSAGSMLELKESMDAWTHLIVLCLGNGLLLDKGLLDQLNRRVGYILVSTAMNRSLRGAEENGAITVQSVFSSMGYIVISSIESAAARDLLSVLPAYEEERVVNTLDWQSSRSRFRSLRKTRQGDCGGLRFSQSRTLDTKPILRQDDLRTLEKERRSLLFNAREGTAWVARIVR